MDLTLEKSLSSAKSSGEKTCAEEYVSGDGQLYKPRNQEPNQVKTQRTSRCKDEPIRHSADNDRDGSAPADALHPGPEPGLRSYQAAAQNRIRAHLDGDRSKLAAGAGDDQRGQEGVRREAQSSQGSAAAYEGVQSQREREVPFGVRAQEDQTGEWNRGQM